MQERLASLLDLERSRSFHEGGVRLDLGRMGRLLRALPDLPWPRVAVHVAGSEGKTSTTELIATGLRAYGLKTATFTSPHLHDVRERVRIDGCFPTDDLLDRARQVVDRAIASVGEIPTFFEYLTALARVLFAEAGAEAVVWETGLGGRLDATRLMHADVCAITTISLEHTAILGSSLAEIAREKAGILRRGAPMALGVGVPEPARREIQKLAETKDSPVHLLRLDSADARSSNRALARLVLDLLAQLGHVPPRTAAIDAAIDRHAVAGRFQVVGDVLFDGAHTVAAQQTLASELATTPLRAVVFGATTGRDAVAMLQPWSQRGLPLVLTRTPGERGVPPAELLASLAPGTPAQSIEDPQQALTAARALAGRGELVLVTGSLYLVGLLLKDAAE
ncbi:MAG: bifunctional folylpolyglutamate synthase/dihydrofolate synthase [Planctomycetota bacterium]